MRVSVCFVGFLMLQQLTTIDVSFVLANEDLQLVILGFRHGNRNPAVFLNDDPNAYEWGWEGAYQLNDLGKKQSYSLGQFLRTRYGWFLGDEYISSQVRAISSSASRCSMTLQSVMAGLYPPYNYSIWNPALNWQPFAYDINDQLLRMYSIEECVTQVDAWRPITDDNLPQLRHRILNQSVVMNYIAHHTGLNASSLSDMADVADNIKNIVTEYLRLEMPTWVAEPSLPGYNKSSMIESILSFSEVHQIACANYKPCREIMAGYWLDDIFATIRRQNHSETKIVLYASHTEIVLSAMKLLGMQVDSCPTSAGFIIEVFSKPTLKLRFLLHSPVPKMPLIHEIELAPSQIPHEGNIWQWSDVNDWIKDQKLVIRNWKSACQIPTYTSISAHIYASYILLISIYLIRNLLF